MAGLISSNMQPQGPAAGPSATPPMGDQGAPPPEQGAPQGVGGVPGQAVQQLTPAAVEAQIRVDPQFEAPFKRVVEAGGRFLFDQKTHQYAIKALESGEGDSIGEKLGIGVAGLMSMLIKKSNGTIPPEVVMPAALKLLCQAVDFMQQSGLDPVDQKEFGLAIRTLTTLLMQAFGADPEKMNQAMGKGGAPAEEPQQPGAGEEGETASEEVAEPAPDDEGAEPPAPPAEDDDDFPPDMTKKE
jgi:hypothetical protein